MRLGLVTILGVLALAMWDCPAARGQGPGRPPGRYSSPYGPTLSPNLDYFRQNTGLLDQYNTYIRPRRQLASDLNRLGQDAARFQQELKNVRQSGAAPTGTGATFMNYSHYYGGGR